MADIERRYREASVIIQNGASLSNALDVRPFAGGVLSMPEAWTGASIAFHHSPAYEGTFQPLYDETGGLIEITAAAGRDIVLPDTLFACSFIKVWSENAGAGQAQAATREITISLKG